MKKYLFFFAVLFLLSACREKNILIEGFGTTSEPMVAAFISPDQPRFSLVLTRNQPAGNVQFFDPQYIPDAIVEVYNDQGQSQLLTYDPFGNNYQADTSLFALREGTTCRLRIAIPGKEQLSATCTVPRSFNPEFSYELDSVDTDSGWVLVNLRVKWKDRAGEKNYYRVSADINGAYEEDGIVFSYSNLMDAGDGVLFDDRKKEGEVLEAKFSKLVKKGVDPADQFIEVRIRQVDEDYYLYHKDLEIIGGNIFSLFQPYSGPFHFNIQGGYGIFCSYVIVVNEQILF